MIYFYFIVSFVFTFNALDGIDELDRWWQKVIATIFYTCICMFIFPIGMGKLLYKLHEKHT
jgi:hypothetical protein